MDTCKTHKRPFMTDASGEAFCPLCDAARAETYFERGVEPPGIEPGFIAVPAAKSTKTTIRLDAYDIARAKTLAAKKGMRYQTFLKSLLHQALDKEERQIK